MTDVWPASLPQQPEREGFQETPPENAVSTKMDVGPNKTRRRSLAAPRHFAMRFKMSGVQVTTLDDFFEDTLKSGALPFLFNHPRTGAQGTFRFTDAKAPVYSALGGDFYTVACEMQLLP